MGTVFGALLSYRLELRLMRNDLLAVGGSEYEWLLDFLVRMQSGDDAVTESDYDTISRLVQRTVCCTRCEDIWNEAVLEQSGYLKKGGVSDAG